MPVTAEPQYHAPYSPVQYLTSSDATNESHARRTSSNTRRKAGDAPDIAAEQTPTPKRSPSLFRRINAAMKARSPPSIISGRRVPPTRDSSDGPANLDPMYAAPSAWSSQHPSSSMNPVSRFRKPRNAEKPIRTPGSEHEVATERPLSPEERRVDELTRQPDPSLSRSRSDVRGYNTSNDRRVFNHKPGESSKHARADSEGPPDRIRSRRTPPGRAQRSEAIPIDSSGIARPSRSPEPHSSSGSGYARQRQRLPADRPVPERSHTQPRTPSSSSGNHPRMGRFGIYASPVPSSTQISSASHENPLPNRRTPRARAAAPAKRVDGWEVEIAPPKTSTQSSSGPIPRPTARPARMAQTHTLTSASNSGSLTLVSDHPLMDMPLPSPPEKMEAKEAEEFARNLTQRMSVLLEMDGVDFSSPSALTSLPEEGDGHSPSSLSSGTTTPTHPAAVTQPAESTHAHSPAPAPSISNVTSSSPFGTFLSSAREMNNAFVRGTGSVWDKLFGKDKGKEKEKAKEPAEASAKVENPKAEVAQKDPNLSLEESDIEGSRDVMLYSPLIPDTGSFVELAASEVVTLYGDGSDEAREREYRAELRRRWADGRGFVSFDALSTIEPVQEEPIESDSKEIREEQDISSQPSNSANTQQRDAESPQPKPREKVIWMPSPDKISVQVLWWGYRIYLPPPILHILNSRTIETAKRAALITAALTWLLENLPLTTLPPILAPAALLLRALVPLLGMIGSFIAWGWKATVSFDRGHGVVLSATWILPIVLVPGTWEDREPPPPVPIPPATTTTSDIDARNPVVEPLRS